MLDFAKLRRMQYQDADNRISNPTDLAAKLLSNLILIMSDMVRKRWHAGICKDSSLQIQKAHIESHAPLIAHTPILLCSFSLDAIQTMWIGS